MDTEHTKRLYIFDKGQTDPALNLALEEYVVRHFPAENDYLLLYVNRPSVIVGKHQNVAEEVNLPFCAKHNIPVFRRISGGGAVYQDLGCLNFSYITTHTLKNFNSYSISLKPILQILQELNLPVKTDARNNLLLFGKKISGNAQFTSAGRLLSHGTLLFNSDLSDLKESLKINQTVQFESRSAKSRRAAVGNICAHSNAEKCGVALFRSLLLKRLFALGLSEYRLNEEEQAKVQQLANEKYTDWNWNFGRSPDSVLRKSAHIGKRPVRLMLRLKKGRICQAQIEGDGDFSDFVEALNGQKYDVRSLQSFLSVWPGNLPGSLEQMMNLLF